jgi:predicted Zn finger-like uncharacterized protein
MFTRCPACHTVHPLNAALLAQGAGKYRCGKCHKVSDALDSLFDEWPDAGASAATKGEIPELGISIDLNTPRDAEFSAEQNSDDEQDAGESGVGRKGKLASIAWTIAALALLIVTVINFTDVFKKPLQENASLQEGLVKIGVKESVPATPYRDLSKIQLITSEMRNHPGRKDALRLSATIVNQASRRQAYPVLEVILMDSGGEALASRQFKPAEYLAEDADIQDGMTPQAYLSVVLDLADPGNQAVGFEFKIH